MAISFLLGRLYPAGRVEVSAFESGGIYLSDFLDSITKILGVITVIVDPAVRGRVTIYSSASFSKEEAFQIQIAVLKNNDAMLIQSGGEDRIVSFSQDE